MFGVKDIQFIPTNDGNVMYITDNMGNYVKILFPQETTPFPMSDVTPSVSEKRLPVNKPQLKAV